MEFNFKRSYSLFNSAYISLGLSIGFRNHIGVVNYLRLYDWFKFIYEMDYKSISAVNLIPILIILYVISTLLGLIVDAIHHYIFRKFEETH